MQIRLLGPVEVVDAGLVVPLGGPRLRTLIGALALCAPDVVSRDALVEGVWDSDPPAGAAKTLRAHVAYLRRRLVGCGELVATRAPGYLLTAPVESVDVHRFQELVASARDAPGHQARADTLRTALTLWRGEVLAGCPAGEWIRAEATRLHEVRLNATEDLFATELALGRPAEVAAQLEVMVARYPMRERLWELLMRALYRSGRQGEALQAYRRARSWLVREIGVEPGAELRRLEAAILAGREDTARPEMDTVVAKPAGQQPGAAPLTSLVGRGAEIAELTALLADRRLVTLTGVGGCGKTRLATAVAERVAARFAGGVRFVDLAPLADPALVAGAVAGELDCGDAAALVGHLRGRSCLLVLDNCEHLVQACAELAAGLLGQCPGLRVLATSREPLGVTGEVAWPVPPLSTPPVTRSLAVVSRYDAVRLFLDRADLCAVRGLTDDDAPDIAALCARLDGLPLAIELAAARTPVLTVAEIAGRLHDPAVLRTARRPGRPQHRAMCTTIAWSYDLLDDTTRDRFRRLAVFAGGFTLAGAEAVWPDGTEAVEVLAGLVAKSLVVVARTAAGGRYRLLETIGRWAAARLAECPDDERDARTRHAAHYLALAEEGDRRLRREEAGGWLTRLAAEHENLRTALAWLDPVGRLRLAVALTHYGQLRGRYAEGRNWLERALPDAPGAPAELAGRALWGTAYFAMLMCDYDDAQRLGEHALRVQRNCGEAAAAARTERLLASVARERGDYPRALALLEGSLPALCDDPAGQVGVLHQIGFTHWLSGDLDSAERALTTALRGHERHGGNPVSLAYERIHLAAIAVYRGQFGVADRLARDGLARCGELDVKEGIAWAWNVLGLVALRRGHCGQAVDALRASLEVHLMIGDRWRQASVLDTLAEALLLAGQPVRAAELSGLAATLWTALRVPVPAQERPARIRTRTALRAALPDGEHGAAIARGAAMALPDVIVSLSARHLGMTAS